MHTYTVDSNKIKYHLIEDFDFSLKSYSEAELIYIYTEIYRLRAFENACYENYKDHMRGFLHLSIGQESIYIAIKSICQSDDIFIGSYRDHCLAYITGSCLQEIAYELLGKKLGICKGKGGSMHLYNNTFFGGNAIVGAQVPLGTGLAFSVSYLNQEKIVFCFIGDGAMNQGQVYESFNLALTLKLRIIYIVENNEYGMWTSWKDTCISDNFYKRWNEMRGIRINSNSFFTIIDVMCKIYKLVQDGPVVVQIDTYRHCGHSMADKEVYRDQNEKDKMLKQDCMKEIQDIIINKGLSEKIEAIHNDVENKTKEYFDNAIKCENPDDDELYTDILK